MELNLPKSACFVYLRRSQDREDRQSLSIGKQDKEVKQIIERNDLTPIYLPPEERSAKYPGRPIFNDMMSRIEGGEARYIAVWASSRLSRNPVDAARVVFAMDNGQLLAVHTPGRVYRNTPDDKWMLQVELANAKKNNDELSVQVREGFDAKRAHGQYPGPAPIGYLNAIITPGERNIVPDVANKAPRVVHLFEMASTGLYNLDDLWKEAQTIGLLSRTGGVLAKQTVTEMLKRRSYTGVFKYGGEEWHQGTYKALISVELYNQVQLVMGWMKRKVVERPATTSGRYYPYKGVLLCKTCKFNITAYTKPKVLSGGATAEYVFYTCTKKSKAVKCSEPQVSSLVLENEIKETLKEYEISESDGLKCIKWLEYYHADYLKTKNQYKPQWVKDRQNAQRVLDTLDEKLEEGVISNDRYKTRSIKHEEVVARTTELLDIADTDADRWLELAKDTFSGVTNIGEVFEMANDQERRQLMTFVGSNWYLSNKKVALTVRKPLDVLHVSNRNTDWRARPGSNRRSPP